MNIHRLLGTVLFLLCLVSILGAEISQFKARKHRVLKKAAEGRKEKIITKEKEAEDPGVIPFLKSTRFKSGSHLTSSDGSSSFLSRIARKGAKAFVNSRVFRYIAEEKIFESVLGMLIWRVAFNMSKDPSSAKKARLLFTMYICLYIGALLYCRNQALQSQDTRTVKVTAMPAIMSNLLDMAKKMKKGQASGFSMPSITPKETEMTYREYDLNQVKTSFDRFSLFLMGMTFLHFKMKNIYMIMYWGILGPIMMIREPIFQVYLLGMEETGIRERPFGPKEEPEEVEEPDKAEEEGGKEVAEEEVSNSDKDPEEPGGDEEEAVVDDEKKDEEDEEDGGAEDEEEEIEEGDDEVVEDQEDEEEEGPDEGEEEEEEAVEPSEEEKDEEEVVDDTEGEEGEGVEGEGEEGAGDDDDDDDVVVSDEEEDEGFTETVVGAGGVANTKPGDVASDRAINELPETFKVDQHHHDVKPQKPKGPEAPEKFQVEKQADHAEAGPIGLPGDFVVDKQKGDKKTEQ